jgi:hypothetical protein
MGSPPRDLVKNSWDMAMFNGQCQSQTISADRKTSILFIADGLLIDTDQIRCEGMRVEDGSIA